MFAQPKLTICVPSRNRQRYFQETIRSQLMNLRTDVEYVFADNSDDALIMNGFMEDLLADPRVKYLPSVDRVLSMVENWDRCVEAATGEFICMIGDDDYVDADVASLIARSQQEHSAVDVFVWSRLTYNWPDNRAKRCNVAVPLKTEVHRIPRAALYREFFSWKGEKATPNMAFGFYHGAVAKHVMDKIKTRFGGKYCEYPTVDFENVCKVLVTAEHIFYSERPFSVLGSCAQSNSAKITQIDNAKERNALFMSETGRNIDDDPHMKAFPFPSILGLAACIAQAQHWFLSTYGYQPVAGWEANFAKACGISCGMMDDQAAYEDVAEGYRTVFRRWKGGKFLRDFKPVDYVQRSNASFFTGIANDCLLIDENIAGVQTPAELYHFVEQLIARPSELAFKLHEHFKAA
ncbi:glycosyltransferase [Pararhizobium sp. YC-54]|uniref:glycosyltransferase family 2 protein n=1 Tax=Pararhizobium sp. YC-54 TaxID=2986920 RepID=UPI0021F73466|nr:glycosyltransferase [Pararhizobium sp. YC-54]MCV9998885.1 glycosyltransferase [Pararhizobium sp. YC-54]